MSSTLPASYYVYKGRDNTDEIPDQRIHGLTTNWSPDSHQNLPKTQICTDQASNYKPFVKSHVY